MSNNNSRNEVIKQFFEEIDKKAYTKETLQTEIKKLKNNKKYINSELKELKNLFLSLPSENKSSQDEIKNKIDQLQNNQTILQETATKLKNSMSSLQNFRNEISNLTNRNNQYYEIKIALYEYAENNNIIQTNAKNIKTKTAGSEDGFIEEKNFVKMTKKNNKNCLNNYLYNMTTPNEVSTEYIKLIDNLFPNILPKTEVQTINDFIFIKTEKAFTNCQDAKIKNIQKECNKLNSNQEQQEIFKQNIGKGVVKSLLFGKLFGCKDIREDNVVFNTKTGEVKIIDYIPPAIDDNGNLNISKTKDAFIDLNKIKENKDFYSGMTNFLVNSQTIASGGFNDFTNNNHNWINTLKKDGYINEQTILEAISKMKKEINKGVEEIEKNKDKNSKEYKQQKQLLEFADGNFKELATKIKEHFNIDINQKNNEHVFKSNQKPEVKALVSKVKEAAPKVKEAAPEVKVVTPGVKALVSEVKEAAPKVKEAAPEVKVVTPEVKQATLIRKREKERKIHLTTPTNQSNQNIKQGEKNQGEKNQSNKDNSVVSKPKKFHLDKEIETSKQKNRIKKLKKLHKKMKKIEEKLNVNTITNKNKLYKIKKQKINIEQERLDIISEIKNEKNMKNTKSKVKEEFYKTLKENNYREQNNNNAYSIGI